jgi:hypothetical protein
MRGENVGKTLKPSRKILSPSFHALKSKGLFGRLQKMTYLCNGIKKV